MSSYSESSRSPGFMRRLVMVLLFTAGVAFWMSVLHRYQTQVSETMMMVFADLAVALAASLSARFTFYDRNWIVRFLAALIALLLGLFALGFMTNWEMGIGSINAWRRQEVEWLEVIQLAGSFVVLLVALRAWWRPPVQVEESDFEAEPVRSSIRQTRRSRSHEPKLPRFHLPTSWTSSSSRNGRLKVRKSRANGSLASEPDRVVVSRPIKPARSRRRKSASRKPELQLSVYEEHRCPYCLEEVKRNDPRGVKECDICHTLHHADCWNVTGMCQIPHLNALNL